MDFNISYKTERQAQWKTDEFIIQDWKLEFSFYYFSLEVKAASACLSDFYPTQWFVCVRWNSALM